MILTSPSWTGRGTPHASIDTLRQIFDWMLVIVAFLGPAFSVTLPIITNFPSLPKLFKRICCGSVPSTELEEEEDDDDEPEAARYVWHSGSLGSRPSSQALLAVASRTVLSIIRVVSLVLNKPSFTHNFEPLACADPWRGQRSCKRRGHTIDNGVHER